MSHSELATVRNRVGHSIEGSAEVYNQIWSRISRFTPTNVAESRRVATNVRDTEDSGSRVGQTVDERCLVTRNPRR